MSVDPTNKVQAKRLPWGGGTHVRHRRGGPRAGQLSQNPTLPGPRNWDLYHLQNQDSQALDKSADS